MVRLKERYNKEIVPQLIKKFGYRNIMEVPRVSKIVLNLGMGESLVNPKAMEAAGKDLTTIAGQHAVITKAKKSIAAFKLRAGTPVGMMVTLRDKRMYEFLDKLVSVVLPRIRDFQGVPRDAFDGQGNYTLGMKEQIVFPEIEYDKVDKTRGLEITIVTSAKTDEDGRHLLEAIGMPFKKN
ncbi:MAG: 50S ribosomal protein L5 [Dehalococcoidia bacterium]|nr:50S ribosomal protein L5 [Dehalococcoidia bacterium]MDD5647317.1 50S ribosomal protein L5 [Dehalococcoidia bacterium]